MLGFGLQQTQITPAIVREVAADFRLDLSAAASEEADSREGFSTALKFLHPKKDDLGRSTTTPIEKTTFLPRVKSE